MGFQMAKVKGFPMAALRWMDGWALGMLEGKDDRSLEGNEVLYGKGVKSEGFLVGYLVGSIDGIFDFKII